MRTSAQSLRSHLTLSSSGAHLHAGSAGGAAARGKTVLPECPVCLPGCPGGLSVTTCDSTAQPGGPNPAPGPQTKGSCLRHRSPARGLSNPGPDAAALLAKLESFQKPQMPPRSSAPSDGKESVGATHVSRDCSERRVPWRWVSARLSHGTQGSPNANPAAKVSAGAVSIRDCSRTGRWSPAATWVGLAPRPQGLTATSRRKTMASSPRLQLPAGPRGSLIHRGGTT